jgi:hypothetical protein
MVTANKIPVPDPIAPMKSANTERAPIQSPPNAAAVGMYLKVTKGEIYSTIILITLE